MSTTSFTGTLYLPDQPPRQLSRTELTSLDLLIRPSRDGNTITARAREVSKILGVRDNDPLFACAKSAVWGLANAADYDDVLDNPEAEEAVRSTCGECGELVGPILIVINE